MLTSDIIDRVSVFRPGDLFVWKLSEDGHLGFMHILVLSPGCESSLPKSLRYYKRDDYVNELVYVIYDRCPRDLVTRLSVCWDLIDFIGFEE
jgi:hypothetical protein